MGRTEEHKERMEDLDPSGERGAPEAASSSLLLFIPFAACYDLGEGTGVHIGKDKLQPASNLFLVLLGLKKNILV